MKVWITKFALTEGIIEAEFFEKYKVEDIYTKEIEISCLCRASEGRKLLLNETDFSYSLEEAKYEAEKMRQKEINSLKNQIEKLERIRFE